MKLLKNLILICGTLLVGLLAPTICLAEEKIFTILTNANMDSTGFRIDAEPINENSVLAKFLKDGWKVKSVQIAAATYPPGGSKGGGAAFLAVIVIESK